MRDNFPQLKNSDLIYLDSAATTLKPQSVIDAISHFYATDYGTVHRGIYSLCQKSTHLYMEARQKVQHFIHAKKPEEIVFTKGTTEGINLVAHSFLKENDTVLITEIEHHSNIVPWQLLEKQKNIKIEVVKVLDSGDLDLDDLELKLKNRPKLLSLAHISNAIGTQHNIKAICHLAHIYGTYVLVDGAQSIAHIPIDVQDLDCDFFCFSSHKMYGPTGIGVLYGKYDLLEQMDPFLGGGDMIDHVTFEKTTFGIPPLKFEAGTPPIAQAVGLGAAIDFLEQNKAHTMAPYAEQKLKEIDCQIIGSPQKRGELISFIVPQIHSLDMATLLNQKNIALRSGHLCAQPALKRFLHEQALRISFGIYNSSEDIDQLIDAIQSIQNKLKIKL